MLKFYLRLANSCTAALLVALLGLSSARASGTGFEYDVNFTLDEYNATGPISPFTPITITGDIVTTCNQCFLNSQANVFSYQFNISGPGVSGTISSSANSAGNPNYAAINASPSNAFPLVALPTGIYFDPSVAAGASPGSNIFSMNPTPSTFSNRLLLSFSGGNPDAYVGPSTPVLAVAGAGVVSLYGPGSSTEDVLGASGVSYPSNEIIAGFSGCTIALDANGQPNCFQSPAPGFSLIDLGPVFDHGINVGENFQLDGTELFVSSVTPVPAALPLFATGLSAMGLFGWRRKRKNTALLAA
jgi:hypothetical protein